MSYEQFDELVQRIVADALAGDPQSTTLLINRLCPQPKASYESIQFTIAGDSLTEKASCILSAIADGAVPPDIGSNLLASLTSMARVVEVDEIVRRLDALEAAHD